VFTVTANTREVGTNADAIVCAVPGKTIAVITADCVPILAATESGRGVAAIHAGWRGLASGVVAEGISALRAASQTKEPIFAVVGPHIGACCYEVDEPVIDAMRERFGAAAVEAACRPTSPGHAHLSLVSLCLLELEGSGVIAEQRAVLAGGCTSCDTARFHSYRREGAAAGRMEHFIATS
jgi:YfiH family protein